MSYEVISQTDGRTEVTVDGYHIAIYHRNLAIAKHALVSLELWIQKTGSAPADLKTWCNLVNQSAMKMGAEYLSF